MKRKMILLAIILSVMLYGCGSGEVEDGSNEQEGMISSSSSEMQEEVRDDEDSIVKRAKLEAVHGITGDVYVYDDNKMVIENFTYDGKAPSTYIALGHHDEEGFFIFETVISNIIVDPYNGEDLIIEAPKGIDIADYDAVSAYCLQYRENFGSNDFE